MTKTSKDKKAISLIAKPFIEKIKRGGIKIAKGGIRITIGTLNIFTTPMAPLLPSIKPLPATWRHEETYRLNKKLLIFDIILSLIVLTLIGSNIFLWLKKPTKLVINLDFKIQPQMIKTGDKVEFILNYGNESKEILKQSTLALKLPTFFILEEIFPFDFDKKTNTILLGDLFPGASGQIKIKGYVVGEVGQNQRISAIISWKDKYNNLKREFRSQTYLIEDSNFKLEILANFKEIFENSPFDLVLKIKNNSLLDFDEVFVLTNSNEFFTDHQEALIDLKKLKSGEEKRITISGRVSREKPLEEKEMEELFKTQLFLKKNGEKLIQAEKEKSFILVFPAFELKQKTEGNAFPDKDLLYTISYQNKEKIDLQDLEIKIKLEGEFFDLERIKTKKGEIKGNEIVWQIKKVKPNQGENLKFQIKVKSEVLVQEPKEEGFILSSSLEASYKMVSDLNRVVKIKTKDLEVKVNSNLKLEARVRYQTPEGDQIGRGPWPPKKDKITQVWIFLKVTNTINKVRDAFLTGFLPPNIFWTDKYSISRDEESLIYNNQTRGLKWIIGEIPKFTDKDISFFGIAFEISFTPQAEEVDKEIILLKTLKLVGRDEFTNDEIIIEIEELKSEKVEKE